MVNIFGNNEVGKLLWGNSGKKGILMKLSLYILNLSTFLQSRGKFENKRENIKHVIKENVEQTMKTPSES